MQKQIDIMENSGISTYTELKLRIIHLKSEKAKQEEELKQSFKAFANSINPVSIVKESIHELARDKEVQVDLTKIVLNIGTNLIINKILGRDHSIKDFLSSLLIEKISGFLENKNVSQIVTGISNLLHKEK
jgi:hypothetical protein